MCRCQHLLTQMRSTVVYWSPGTHLSLGARVGEGCKEVLTLFPRLDTHEKPSQDPSSATERRQSRFLLNCRCRVAAKAGVSEGGGRRGRWGRDVGIWGACFWEIEVGWHAVGAQLVFLAWVNEILRSRPPPRPAVLYQEYSDVASARELRRQQREEEGTGDGAEGAEEGPGPPRANLSPSSSFRAQRSARGSTFSLWQDIPDVRGSGVLATLSLRDCKLQEVRGGAREAGDEDPRGIRGCPRGEGVGGVEPRMGRGQKQVMGTLGR